MYRFTLYVPELTGNGERVTGAQLASFENDLHHIAEISRAAAGLGEAGFTASRATGSWRSPDGVVFREPVVRYEVDLADVVVVGSELRDLAEQICLELGQAAVYSTVSELDVFVVTGGAGLIGQPNTRSLL